MVRTEVELTEEQAKKLDELADRSRVPLPELIRNAVDELLRRSDEERAETRRRALAASGRFRSGLTDLAENHDAYLEEAFGH